MTRKQNRYIRSIKKEEETKENLNHFQAFPKDKPGVIYVRQSTLAQVQKNLHSYEMQTEEFERYFRENIGVTGHIEIITDDEGKSGTLDIHDRKGLMRVMNLVEGKELLHGKRIGWIGAVHVNRLTRDQWLIVPGVLMRECYEHDVWIATLRMQFNFQDEYCRRVFMLEAEEAARNLKWMREIMTGGRQAASNRGYYDGRTLVPGYIVDYREYLDNETKNPYYKRLVVYKPHATIVQWLFQRYLKLDGNFAQLCREIEAMPFFLPAFEPWVDRRCINKFNSKRLPLNDGPYKGCYGVSKNGLLSLLTNPIYIGWWIPMGGGVLLNNHEALVEEALFTYAHKRLSIYDLQGNRQKPAAVTRNGNAEALLKKVMKGTDSRTSVYARIGGEFRRKPVYCGSMYVGLHEEFQFIALVSLLDNAFVEKLLEKLEAWEAHGDLAKWKEKISENKAEKSEQKKQIEKSIREATARMQRINEIITDIDNPPSKSQENALKQMYRDLEAKITQLELDLKGLPANEEEAEVILFHIWELIPKIKMYWAKLPFEEKMKIVGAFTRQVVVSIPSPGWLKMDVIWKIGQCDTMHVRRHTNVGIWSQEEEAILRELYPTKDGMEVLRNLPARSWGSIITHAYVLKIKRTNRDNSAPLGDYRTVSLQDIAYTQENGLIITDKNPQWSKKNGRII